MSGSALLETKAGSPALTAVLAFRVDDWAACGVSGPERVEWLTAGGGAADQRSSAPLPSILRRRVTAIGQRAFEAATRLSVSDGTRFVFCSRHGEYQRTQRLIEAIAAGESTSPADFSLSVHHALAGLLSIASANTAGHTAVAAGIDSFGVGLVEAAACLATGEESRALVVYFDEPLPADYAPFCQEQDAFAAALVLSRASGEEGDLLLSLEPVNDRLPRRSATEQAADFIGFLHSGEPEFVSRGARGQWRWRRADA